MAEGDTIAGRVRPVIRDDAMVMLAWRNHPSVREHMFSTAEISADEHRAWLDRSLGDPSRVMLIYEQAGVPLGFVGLHVGRHPKVADWGFYTAPDAPKGSGKLMARCALALAFSGHALHKVCGQALEANERSIGFHRALGFIQEGVLRAQHFDGQRYQSVVCFGLLKHEWAGGAEV